MATILVPKPNLREDLETHIHAESHMCWTCGSCVAECPVNIATKRLSPRKIVWLTNLGLQDELLGLPEVWYCQTCNRCNQICPMTVKPADIILYARLENERRGYFEHQRLRAFRAMYARFQRIRWHAAAACLQGDCSMEAEDWQTWYQEKVSLPATPLKPDRLDAGTRKFKRTAKDVNTSACFTCGKCCSACPVFYERGVFDPMALVRMVNLGMIDQLMTQPSIWLCIACGRCSDGCSQKVAGHRLIRTLQEFALDQGTVDTQFPLRWQTAQTMLFTCLLDEIDALFGFTEKRNPATSPCEFEEREVETV